MVTEETANRSTQTRVTSYRDRLIKRFDKTDLSSLARGRARSGPLGRVISTGSAILVRIGGIASTILGNASYLAAIAGMTLAILLTGYLIAEAINPEALPVRLPEADPDFKQNLRAGAVFFWFELFAIIGMLRIYDEFLMDRRNRKQIDNLLTDLEETVRIAELSRDNFVGKLDRFGTPDGLFNVNYAELNIELAKLRQAFILLSMCDPDLTPYVHAISDRVLTILDRMVGESYDAVELLYQRHEAKDPAGLFQALQQLFDVTDPRIQGLSGLQDVLHMARRAV